MRRIIFLLLFPLSALAQDPELSKEDKAILDSLLANDEFLLMLKDMRKGKSYAKLGLMGANSYFSIRNKRLNTIQLENKMVFTPSVSYFHKSGFGLAAAGYYISNKPNSDFYQYSGTGLWSDSKSKTIDATISYTRFFRKKGFELITTPLENDFYGRINLEKSFIQPGLSFGYADGSYTTYHRIDTVLFGIRRVFTDTMKTSVRDIALALSIQHYLEYENIFSKNDGIGITPQLMINAGTGSFEISHRNPFLTRLQNRNPERYKNAGLYEDNGKLEFRSIAFNLEAIYAIGKFGISPQFYLDYYLPATTDNRWAVVMSVELSLTLD